MRRLVLLLVAATMLGTSAAQARSSAQPGLRGTVWVANKATNDVAVFDASTGAVTTIPVGKNPNSVVVAAGKAYVSNEDDNSVSVISTASRAVVATIPTGLKPHHIRSSRDGKRVYVAEYGTNKIGVIDTASDRLLDEYTMNDDPATLTHAPWITFDGKTLLGTDQFVDKISAVDAATGQFLYSLPVGILPSEILATRDGKTAFVSVRAENAVKSIDLASHTVTGHVDVGTQPDTLQLSPDGKTLIVALRGTPAQISYVDVSSGLTLAATVDVAGAGTLAGHNGLSANGRYSFVAFEGGSAPGLAVVDNGSRTVIATYAYPGGGKPHGVFYDDPAATSGPNMAIGTGAVSVGRSGAARLTLACGADTVIACKGRVSLRTRGGRTLGNGMFRVVSAATTTVSITVTPTTLAGLRRGPIEARAVAVAEDGLGNSGRIARSVRLSLKRT